MTRPLALERMEVLTPARSAVQSGEHSPKPAATAAPIRGATSRQVEPEPSAEIVPEKRSDARPRTPKIKLLAGASALAFIGAGSLVVLAAAGVGVAPPVEGAAAVASASAVPATPTEAPVAAAAAQDPDPMARLEATVRELKSAGNWHVLVLHAGEWTRREPKNAEAWSELSGGYAQLRQFDDAINAANKAAQLSPQDPRLWRALGQLNLAVDELPDAAAAFDRALALAPDDADTLCGAAAVAQKLRPKTAGKVVGRANPADGRCPAVSEAETAMVAVQVSPAPTRAASIKR